MKTILKILIAATLLLIAMIYFSPYKHQTILGKKGIVTTVKINTSLQKLYAYLGNSNNARQWSSYVHHITTLNADTIADGQIGSIRRCFKNENEKGVQWDEVVTQNIINNKREIQIYNAHDFLVYQPGLYTSQLYTAIDSNTTQLQFCVYYHKEPTALFALFKTHFAAYTIQYIFNKNLANIKKYNE
jgi:hypothetical protein